MSSASLSRAVVRLHYYGNSNSTLMVSKASPLQLTNSYANGHWKASASSPKSTYRHYYAGGTTSCIPTKSPSSWIRGFVGLGTNNYQEITRTNGASVDTRRSISTIDGVKVDVTNTVSTSASTSETDKNNTPSKNDDGADNSSTSRPKLKKSPHQKAEEELSLLSSHVKEHFNHANYTAALDVAEDILSKSLEIFGKIHPATASAYNNIGLMYKMMGDFETSRTNYHEALIIYEGVVGKDHQSYAAALNNLGNLDRTQSMVGTRKKKTKMAADGLLEEEELDGDGDADEEEEEALSTIERIQLNDSAAEYFEEAWNIRKAELGEEHVYTVTSRTNLGGAIAAQLLQSELLRQKKLRENKEKKKKSGDDDENADQSNDNDQDKDTAWAVSKYTREKWDAAEDHLRAAFRTSVNSPRGEQVVVPEPSSSSSSDSIKKIKGSDWKKMSGKEKKKASKLKKKMKREERRNSTSNIQQGSTDNNGLGVGDIKICTLSSAATGQNLAVFLKLRADLISNLDSAPAGGEALDSGDMYAEAKNLYLGALRVRTSLKGEYHPDTVATKFSLAELFESLGDEKGANTLRQELLDSYNVEEHVDASASAEDNGSSSSSSKH